VPTTTVLSRIQGDFFATLTPGVLIITYCVCMIVTIHGPICYPSCWDYIRPLIEATTTNWQSLPELVYPTHDIVRRVRHNGRFRFRHRSVYLTMALVGQEVGLREVDHELWLISFMNLDLGYLDSRKMELLLEPNQIKAACSSNAVREIVLPM
jgi:hypothetical protein